MKPKIGEKVWVWFHWNGSYSIANGVVTGILKHQACVLVQRCPFMKGITPATVYPRLEEFGKRPYWVSCE